MAPLRYLLCLLVGATALAATTQPNAARDASRLVARAPQGLGNGGPPGGGGGPISPPNGPPNRPPNPPQGPPNPPPGPPNPPPGPPGPSARRRDMREIEIAGRLMQALAHPDCPAKLTRCNVGSVGLGYECIDTMNELNSCGGCITDGSGVDCESLPGIAMGGVTCHTGTCVVSHCQRGFVRRHNGRGGECVESRLGAKEVFPVHNEDYRP